jgi:hypothetical protein
VEAYGKSIDYAIDGHEFVNFYQSKGWMIGRNKMVDWRAAVGTWKERERKETAKHGSEKTGRDNTPPEPIIR